MENIYNTTYGICPLSVIALRGEPSHRAEQVSQILFGETFTILQQHEQWTKIHTDFDNYSGWVDSFQIQLIDFKTYTQIKSTPIILNTSANGYLIDINNTSNIQPLSIGAVVSNAPFLGKIFKNDTSEKLNNLNQIINLYYNTPYLWGGRTNWGIDCSGFCQGVFRFLGIFLPRDAYQQGECGQTIERIEQTQLGDLAFFANEQGRITHTGIIIDNGHIAHAHTKVRIDTIDNQGIFNSERQKYSHQLHSLKRILLNTNQ